MGLGDRTPPTAEEYASWREKFCNWGRWGDDDELGTLNHITPEARRRAASLVQDGRSVCLARPLDTAAGPANPYPAHHMVPTRGSGGMMDWFGMFIHGFTQTHIDALCHLTGADGQSFYNGKTLDPYRMSPGRTGTIEWWRHGIVTRGVLYDIPRLRGTEYVETGHPVHGWDLLDAAAAQGVEPAPGDAVLIRSGHGRYFELHPDEKPPFGSPSGVHCSALEFLFETDAAVLAWDWQDAPIADQGIPNPLPITTALHVHHIAIPYMGLPLIDNADLEELARACAEAGRWEFQFICAPLVLLGGTGSPVNPLAVL
jgi:kynurenine formamidase